MTYKIGDVTVGCGICYDIRFPELFQRLRDLRADVIVLPAAFTLSTGKDHWEILARARAIETQTYFVAVGQTGTHASGRKALRPLDGGEPLGPHDCAEPGFSSGGYRQH